MRLPCSSIPACAADQNSDGPHYAAPGVPGSPWYPRDLRSGMHPDIGIAGRKSAANIEHGVLIITAVNSVRTFQNRMTATVRTSGDVVLSSFLFHGSVSSKIKIRKVAPPQAAKRTSSPCGHCSRATFRQSQKQTHAIMDRSSLTSALISAHPLVTSDAGSSDQRTNDLGATFLSVSILYHIVHLFSRSIYLLQIKFTSRS